MASHGDERHVFKDTRKRSRSPYRESSSHGSAKSRRARSPNRSRRQQRGDRAPAIVLPFNARKLHKHDLDIYRALLADYLDIQKQVDIYELSEDEVKGRWKSFLGKWNRCELAEGWYDPETRRKTDERHVHERQPGRQTARIVTAREAGQKVTGQASEDEDDDYGPVLPAGVVGRSSGPALPNLQDLQHRQELSEQDRGDRAADLRYERKVDRQTEKERLEELAPRAEPGSRERQLEKKRENAAANRSFRDSKEAGVEEVGEGELMGDDDGVEGYKAKIKAQTRQKNEREIRKEEVLRARAVEREERMAAHRQKEDKTMEMLKAMAKQRYG